MGNLYGHYTKKNKNAILEKQIDLTFNSASTTLSTHQTYENNNMVLDLHKTHKTHKTHNSERAIQRKTNTFFNHNCSCVRSCSHTKRVINIMNKYNTNENMEVNTDIIPFSKIIDDYIQTIYVHDEDAEFKFITETLGHCDKSTCDKFNRNFLNENIIWTNKEDMIFPDILDKMHCYFYHCYDIGNKIKPDLNMKQM
eukprot:55511_1